MDDIKGNPAWEGFIRRGWKDTVSWRALLGLLCGGGLTASLTFLADRWDWLGEDINLSDELIFVVLPVAGAALWGIALLLFNTVRAPFKQRNEARDVVKELRGFESQAEETARKLRTLKVQTTSKSECSVFEITHAVGEALCGDGCTIQVLAQKFTQAGYTYPSASEGPAKEYIGRLGGLGLIDQDEKERWRWSALGAEVYQRVASMPAPYHGRS